MLPIRQGFMFEPMEMDSSGRDKFEDDSRMPAAFLDALLHLSEGRKIIADRTLPLIADCD